MSDPGKPGDVEVLVAKLASGLEEYLARHNRDAPLMVGVHTGGVWVARKLHQLLTIEASLGTLNINFYRDDFTRIGMHPMVTPSDLFSSTIAMSCSSTMCCTPGARSARL